MYYHGGVGSWQLHGPMPDPLLQDDILFPRWEADVAALHARLPDRDIYRLYFSRQGTRLVKLDPDHPEQPGREVR